MRRLTKADEEPRPDRTLDIAVILAYVESILRRESSEQAVVLTRRQRAAGPVTGEGRQ